MLIEPSQMIPVTRLQKKLTQTVREVAATGDAVYVLKNSNLEAVLLPYKEYDYLKTLEEAVEQFEIRHMLDERMKTYNPRKNVAWETLRDEA